MAEQNEKQNIVRSRFAPSPTGFLQLGNLRTALFAYLFAKKNNGIFILRIEDTDPERSKPEYEKAILETLKWTGLLWDEGPEADGIYGPYRQSEKLDVYEKYLKQLLSENKAFYCFCSEDELETYRQYQLSQGQLAIYSGKCRTISLARAQERLDRGEKAIIRFKNTVAEPIVFNDMIRAKTEFDPSLIGDFSIARDRRSPLYNFSCVIDDFETKITHVVRGEDHISNTPKQIMLQRALGFSSPEYAHLPMILAPDRSKLSKRHGAMPVLEYKEEGYLPEALINFLALLGWHPEDDREIFTLKGLLKEFSLERVQKSGAIFNQQRLDWLNGFYIRNLAPESLTKKCLPYLIKNDLIKIMEKSVPLQLIPALTEESWQEQKYEVVETKEIIEFDYLTKIISLYHQRLKKLSEIIELTDFFFKENVVLSLELLRWKGMTDREVKESLEKLEGILAGIKPEDWQLGNLEAILIPEAEKMGDRGRLLWPLRSCLSGKQSSAGPFEIANVLGKDKTIERIKQAIKIAQN